MHRASLSALLVVIILTLSGGCSEPSPLSPLADENPVTFEAAKQEMAEVARRNREAEAAFHRKIAAARPTAKIPSDVNPDRPQPVDLTAETRKKS